MSILVIVHKMILNILVEQNNKELDMSRMIWVLISAMMIFGCNTHEEKDYDNGIRFTVGQVVDGGQSNSADSDANYGELEMAVPVDGQMLKKEEEEGEIGKMVLKQEASSEGKELAKALGIHNNFKVPVVPGYNWEITQSWAEHCKLCNAKGYNKVYGDYCVGADTSHLWNCCRYSWDFNLPGTADKGLPVVASGAGVVQKIGKSSGWGNYVVISHSDKVCTRYAHMKNYSSQHLTAGQWVCQGFHLGDIDQTGNADGTHLHFQFEDCKTGVSLPMEFTDGNSIPMCTIGGDIYKNGNYNFLVLTNDATSKCAPDGGSEPCGPWCNDLNGRMCKGGQCLDCKAVCKIHGYECGPDDCGGSCGKCPVGVLCKNGYCGGNGDPPKDPPGCIPSCAGKNCGPNGCGGVCGECPDGYNLMCKGGQCIDCQAVCKKNGYQCGPNDCGGSCGKCPVGVPCKNGYCVEGPPGCVPSCSNKECGNDGCDGSCGVCELKPYYKASCVSNKCVYTPLPKPPCIPSCSNKECGNDGCDGSCGVCELKPYYKASCVSNKCVYTPLPKDPPKCVPSCAGKNCGTDGCGGVCGECPDGYNLMCKGGQCIDCQAVCKKNGYQCGPNDCGGSCGTCPAGVPCKGGYCNADPPKCVPSCEGKECGNDGCEGSCGKCELKPYYEADCVSNKCVYTPLKGDPPKCAPSCDGKQCGFDGCGKSCGVCPDVQGFITGCSSNGMCTFKCVGLCSGKDCGSDGCGGSCGICDEKAGYLGICMSNNKCGYLKYQSD